MASSYQPVDRISGVETRARPPHSLAREVERRLLLERFRDGLERQVLLVRAPAGYGKTTLLARAMREARARGVACVWLTIDASDAPASQFIRNLARAVVRAAEDEGRDGAEAARAAAESDEERRLARLARALSRLADRVALFVDDAHLARGEPFGHALDALLRALPDNSSLVISGRARPCISFSAARARGLLAEITASELAFTRAETEALWAGAASDGDLALLAARCEGWAAPLQLALQRGDPGAVGGAGRQMHVTLREYIEDAVLRALSPRAREALTRGAIAPQFSRDLAEALTGFPMDAETREELSGLAPLVTTSESPREGFRPHPLLREAVAADLERRGRPAIVALHATAARWFGGRGEWEAAIRRARRGG